MNLEIADLANHDLRNAATTLYRASLVLKNIPVTPADAPTKIALYQSAKLAVRSVRIVLANITTTLETIEATQELAQ